MQNEPQLSAEMEKRLIGKNVHSVYTRCFVCHSWGVNLPLNHQCGNCNSNETTVYYDIETIAQALATALEEQRAEYEKKVKLQREYVEAGRNGIDRFAEGYIAGLDFLLRILTQKEDK